MTFRAKLLVVGGSYSDIPLIIAAKKLGFFVISSGNRSTDLGHQHSDEICLVDYSNKEALLKVAQEYQINAICSGCNDFAVISSSYVAEKMLLPGYDSYDITRQLHLKNEYRYFANKNKLPTPNAESFSNINEALESTYKRKLPLIVKPVDLTGGKGISKIENFVELRYKFERALSISRSKQIIIEDFLEGSRHGLSAFIINSKIAFYCIDKEHYYLNPFHVSAASMPGNISNTVRDDLLSQIVTIAKLLDLCDGIFHLQFIIHNSMPIIIEICRRSPGDLYLLLAQHYTGINYAEFIIRGIAGLPYPELNTKQNPTFYVRHCILAEGNGTLSEIYIDPSLKIYIIDSFIYMSLGELINDYLRQKIGIIILKFDKNSELEYFNNNFTKLIHIKIK